MGKLVNWLRRLLGVQSPSRLCWGYMEAFAQGFADGVDNAVNKKEGPGL